MKLTELDLHVTNRCTTNCSYCCFSSSHLHLDELSAQEIFDLLSRAKDIGCEDLHITGGEPLLRSDLEKIIEYASDYCQFKVRLQTNGYLLDKSRLKNLTQSGLESIMISLDSLDPDINDQLRGKGSFLKAIRSIDLVQQTNLRLRVNSVITKLNALKLHELIVFLKHKGVFDYSAFYFSPIGNGRNHEDLWIRPKDYLVFWSNLHDAIVSQGNTLNNMNIIIEKAYATWDEAREIDTSGFSGCGGGCTNAYRNRKYLIIRCDGNVYPCILGIDSKPLGNIHTNTLTDIWLNSPEWAKLISSNAKECKTCIYKELCNGGCVYYPQIMMENAKKDSRCIRGQLVPLCPIMKYNFRNEMLGGSSDDVDM